MSRSLKKGPFVDGHLAGKVDQTSGIGQPQGHQDLEPPLHHHA